jgi:hypothetical protein
MEHVPLDHVTKICRYGIFVAGYTLPSLLERK